MRSYRVAIFAFLFLMVACQKPGGVAIPSIPPTFPPTPSPSPTIEPSPSPFPTGTAAPPQPETPAPTTQVCSPLEGVEFAQLTEMVVNPFNPPPLGSDDPHQAVDFADRRPGDGVALEGKPVHAVLAGKVASVITGRFPYGNAILVETPLEDLPDAWLSQLQVPTPGPTLEPRSALTCPPGFSVPGGHRGRSLYLLYAHMKEPVDFRSGQELSCGQTIGAIGSTGNALNPHLHLEVRIGPSGASFRSIAHYDNSASAEEMANYCAWRVSGLFQLIDPLRLFLSVP